MAEGIQIIMHACKSKEKGPIRRTRKFSEGIYFSDHVVAGRIIEK